MDEETFIRDFEEAVEDIGSGTLSAGTRFRELPEWDSLAVLTVLAMVDSEYGVRLRAEDLKTCETLGEFFALVREKSGT